MERLITINDRFTIETSLKGKRVRLEIDASELSDADLTERLESSFKKLTRDQYFSGKYGKLDPSRTEYSVKVKPIGVRAAAAAPAASIESLWARLSEEERRAFLEKVSGLKKE